MGARNLVMKLGLSGILGVVSRGLRAVTGQKKVQDQATTANSTFNLKSEIDRYIWRMQLDSREFERQQISRELHDCLGSNLTALSISLDMLRRQLSHNANQEIRSRLDDADLLLGATARAIEDVMSELRPPMLDDYGLFSALRWHADGFFERTGVTVLVIGDEQIGQLPRATEITLFRIVQEALNNVAKHARASQIRIVLERSDSMFIMSIWDNGVGYDTTLPSASRRRPGLGIVLMRERAHAVRGQFEIGTAPERGTKVVVRIPC